MSPACMQLPRRIGCSCPPSRAAAGYSGRGRVTDGCGGDDPRSSGKTSYRPLVVGRSLVVQSTSGLVPVMRCYRACVHASSSSSRLLRTDTGTPPTPLSLLPSLINTVLSPKLCKLLYRLVNWAFMFIFIHHSRMKKKKILFLCFSLYLCDVRYCIFYTVFLYCTLSTNFIINKIINTQTNTKQ